MIPNTEIIVPKKTVEEERLNKIYMVWIGIKGIIPNSVVDKFLNDVENIRAESELYYIQE